jgi:hypothetical protein
LLSNGLIALRVNNNLSYIRNDVDLGGKPSTSLVILLSRIVDEHSCQTAASWASPLITTLFDLFLDHEGQTSSSTQCEVQQLQLLLMLAMEDGSHHLLLPLIVPVLYSVHLSRLINNFLPTGVGMSKS